jgi:hypothetical protein
MQASRLASPISPAAPALHSWKPVPASRTQNSHHPQALFSHDCSSSCGYWMLSPGKQAPELPLPTGLNALCLQELPCLLVARADKLAPGLLLLKAWFLCTFSATVLPSWSPWPASRPQNSYCLLARIPHACSSCCGSWEPTPQYKQTPGPLLYCGHQKIQTHKLCYPQAPSTCYPVPGVCCHICK